MKLRNTNRILYLLIVGSFFLPFATVRSCMGDETEGASYTGIQLLAKESGSLLVAVLAMAALLFGFSFRRPALSALRNGVAFATEALLCAIAVLVTYFATGLAFMFSRVNLQLGFFICVASWFSLQLLFTRAAIRAYAEVRSGCREPPPPWGLLVGTLVLIVIVATAYLSAPNGIAQLLVGTAAGLLICVPLVLLAMVSAAWFQLRRQGAVTAETE